MAMQGLQRALASILDLFWLAPVKVVLRIFERDKLN